MSNSQVKTVVWIPQRVISQTLPTTAADGFIDRDNVLDVGNAPSLTLVVKVWGRITSATTFKVKIEEAAYNSDQAFAELTTFAFDVNTTSGCPYLLTQLIDTPKRYYRHKFYGSGSPTTATIAYEVVALIPQR